MSVVAGLGKVGSGVECLSSYKILGWRQSKGDGEVKRENCLSSYRLRVVGCSGWEDISVVGSFGDSSKSPSSILSNPIKGLSTLCNSSSRAPISSDLSPASHLIYLHIIKTSKNKSISCVKASHKPEINT